MPNRRSRAHLAGPAYPAAFHDGELTDDPRELARWVTPEQVAAKMHCSVREVLRMCRYRGMPCRRQMNGTFRIPARVIEPHGFFLS